MPEACANALAPTTALLGCTTKPVVCATSRDAGTIWRGVDAECRGRSSRARVRTAITTSSSEQLPARSPRPLMVHSTWRAPPICTPASELATAMPRSLWQCTDQTALSEFGMRSRSVRMKLP